MTSTPRYTARPFPAYRHVPGRTPHPTRDPDGHSFGVAGPSQPSLDGVDWRTCEAYLYGVDLFNAGYWWECHEALEGLWHATGHSRPAGQCLQAMIQCAVAHLKIEIGNARGARQLLANAERHAGAAGDDDLGCDLDALLIATRDRMAGRSDEPALIRLRDL